MLLDCIGDITYAMTCNCLFYASIKCFLGRFQQTFHFIGYFTDRKRITGISTKPVQACSTINRDYIPFL